MIPSKRLHESYRIPKIIHLCWLSGDPFPEGIQRCIDSWKAILPEYKIILWAKNRFDINSVPYVKKAFEAKKYAFCAVYIRIYALYKYGGIYLDSDVMVYNSFDPFLNLHAFASIEFHSYFMYAHISNKKEKLVGIEAAVLGSEKGASWLKDILDYYEGRHFSMKRKKIDSNIMPRVIARILHNKYGFEYFPIFQELKNGMNIYPAEVFSSIRAKGTIINYSAHLGANSWNYQQSKLKLLLRITLEKCGLINITRKIRGIEKI